MQPSPVAGRQMAEALEKGPKDRAVVKLVDGLSAVL